MSQDAAARLGSSPVDRTTGVNSGTVRRRPTFHEFPEGVDLTGVSLPDGAAIKSLDHFGWLATNCCRIKRCLAEDDLKRLTRVQGFESLHPYRSR